MDACKFASSVFMDGSMQTALVGDSPKPQIMPMAWLRFAENRS